MSSLSEFDDIRPYNDDEVGPTLKRLMADTEFLDAVIKLRKPSLGRLGVRLLRPLARRAIASEFQGVNTVFEFQKRLEKYMREMFENTETELTVSGLEHLEKGKAYCFISNHRDIAMDPGCVNWTLYQNGFQTLRIAIGDNLLTKPFASDLMRLNKCFIVNRSATAPREKLQAAKKLSNYINHSVSFDNANIWIAQREGRAKDGIDKTNSAIIRMLTMARPKEQSFGEFIAESNFVPVSISYEWDPCDVAKANELTTLERQGSYEKGDQEDVRSIAMGIAGKKGRVHLAFGQPLGADFDNPDQVVEVLDRSVLENYVLQPTNCVAYEMIEKKTPCVPVTASGLDFRDYDATRERVLMQKRVEACPPENREMLLRIYANPVYSKLKLKELANETS